MAVHRISKQALDVLLGGVLEREETCVIKFYSNTCHLCHNLQPHFEELAGTEDYANLHFFAFNIEDDPTVAKRLKFQGVPTISIVKTGSRTPHVRVLGEPEDPDKHTWYTVGDIKKFLAKEDTNV